MRIRLFGGWQLEHDGTPVDVPGAMQRGLLFRLALDAGTTVGYRALAEDLWDRDPPENPRAALQSLVSRLRPQLPEGVLTSASGGYRLEIARGDVDAVRFQDLVSEASAALPDRATVLAGDALALWLGEPWTPVDGYDWFVRALATDRATALRLAGSTRSASSTPTPDSSTELVTSRTELIGRDTELVTVAAQLERARLVTILGAGGAGKTRLAIEAARRIGVAVIVELAPVGPDELWTAVLGALGREVRSSDPSTNSVSVRDRVVAALAGRELVLVVDNCEHVIEPAADLVNDLLTVLPRLRVLATSREPLGVHGEAFVPLGPLAPVDASRLFDDRVRAARGEAIQSDELDAARRIRDRLDGLPLALELAAAKARTLTLAEIDVGLDDRFALLAGGPRTVLPRHQTLRALIDWSWDLLSEGERLMLQVAAIYPAGIGGADADAIASAHGGMRSDLDSLVDKSLVQRAGGRLRTLETIREYGLLRLGDAGQLVAERTVQARWLAEASVAHDAGIRGAGIHDALAWFDAEDDNVVAALRFATECELADETLRLAAGNAWYWVIRDRNQDAVVWLTAAAPFAEGRDSEEALLVQAVALMAGSLGAFGDDAGLVDSDPQSAFEGASPLPPESVERLKLLTAGTENSLLQAIPVIIDAFTGAFEAGTWLGTVEFPPEDELDIGPWARAMLAVMRAAVAQNRGDIDELGVASARALQLFQQNGDLWGQALSKQMRAEYLVLHGDLDDALRLSDESTAAMRRITSSWDLQQQQGLAVTILLRQGKVDDAIERAELLIAEARASGASRSIVLADTTRAMVAVQLGERERAKELIAEIEGLVADWPKLPLQMSAIVDVTRGGLAMLDGDLDAAEERLRSAADAAAASRDHPVMAMVAVQIGLLAVGRRDLHAAAGALQLAVSLRGAADPLDAGEIKLRAAINGASPAPALESGGAGLDRNEAAEALAQILRR
ncbi:BTAD domain-containing putative transcriptional regulator [soil metagenome]